MNLSYDQVFPQGNQVITEQRGSISSQGTVDMNLSYQDEVKVHNVWNFECYDKDGNLKWAETIPNLVTNVGLNDILDKYLKGSGYTAAWFVGLKGTGTIAAADTMASHAGWTEVVDYSEGARQTLTLGTVASQSVSNTASKAVFSINGTATVAGAFINTVSTKSGTTGILYGVANFASARSVESGDTLNVTVTLTAASA